MPDDGDSKYNLKQLRSAFGAGKAKSGASGGNVRTGSSRPFLAGRWFIAFDDNSGRPRSAGKIVDERHDMAIVEILDFLGFPCFDMLVPFSQMTRWHFYHDIDDFKEAISDAMATAKAMPKVPGK